MKIINSGALRLLPLFLTLFVVQENVNAQYPSFADYVISSPYSTQFKYENCFLNSSCYQNQDKRKTEIPPWIVGGGWRSYFFVDGRETNIWSSPQSLIWNSSIDLKNDAVGPYKATAPYINESFSPAVHIKNWKRNYAGIYSANYFSHVIQGTITLGFTHGENKNEITSGNCGGGNGYQNTIQQNVTIDCNNHATYTSSGVEGWDAYNGFVSASWIPNNSQTNWGQGYFQNEIGPIAWPNNGYTTANGIKCTAGFRHPSSILYNDQLYIYVVQGGSYNGNIPETEGRKGGVKLIRVHKDQALDAANYTIYYKDINNNVTWNPSLPTGLTKDNMLTYVSTAGPKSTDVLNDNNATVDVVRFSVAKVRNRNYFMGVEEYHEWGSSIYKIAIRFSDDLLNWSTRQIVYQSSSWETSSLNYPIFLDNTGWSNTDVDEDDFYILGTEHGPIDHVNKIHLYKYIPPPPPPPPTECPPGVICEEVPGEKSQLSVQPEDNNIQPSLSAKIRLYPNPARNFVTLELNSSISSSGGIIIRDASMRKVQHIQLTNQGKAGLQKYSFDISRLTPGVYFVEVHLGAGRVVHKIVKL